jgi:glycosyltransferase involved in cell wall biosynthesis
MSGAITKNIIFISKSEQSASTRYRALAFFPMLKKNGWTPHHYEASDRINWIRKIPQADVVVVLRKTFTWPWLMMLRRFSKRLIYDFDDAVFMKSDESPSRVRHERFQAILNSCDGVFAGNDFLLSHCKNKKSVMLPTSIDLRYYPTPLPVEIQSGPPTLVWIGSSSTRKYLEDIMPSLDAAALKVPGLTLKVIADFDLSASYLNVKNIPWSQEVESYELGESHVGIAPLRDDIWCRGKCALKLLQYQACGLPVISSAVGANYVIVNNAHSGLLVEKPEDWQHHIYTLFHNPELSQKLGINGRKHVEKQYSLDSVSAKMLAFLEGMVV